MDMDRSNGEGTLNELWAILSEQWAHSERNLVNAYELWTLSERRVQMEHKHKRKMNGECTVNDIWTQDRSACCSDDSNNLIQVLAGRKKIKYDVVRM